MAERCRYRFRTRDLLIATTVIAVLAAWLGIGLIAVIAWMVCIWGVSWIADRRQSKWLTLVLNPITIGVLLGVACGPLYIHFSGPVGEREGIIYDAERMRAGAKMGVWLGGILWAMRAAEQLQSRWRKAKSNASQAIASVPNATEGDSPSPQ